jgi:hypothetical protein
VSCLISRVIHSSYSVPATNTRASPLFDRSKAEIVVIYLNMSHFDQTGESCPSQDMGEDAAKYQYPPPPGEGYEHTRAYPYQASSNSSAIPVSLSYDSQFLQPDGYPPVSRVNPQQSLLDYGRDELGYWDGFQHMSFTHSAPRQRAAIACRYCRRRKVRRFSLLNTHWIAANFLPRLNALDLEKRRRGVAQIANNSNRIAFLCQFQTEVFNH